MLLINYVHVWVWLAWKFIKRPQNTTFYSFFLPNSARPQEDTIHFQQISKFSSNDKAKLLLNANDVAMLCYILHRIFHLNKQWGKTLTCERFVLIIALSCLSVVSFNKNRGWKRANQLNHPFVQSKGRVLIYDEAIIKPGGDVCKVALATSVSRHLNKPALTHIVFFHPDVLVWITGTS